jgi:hypothetical protein
LSRRNPALAERAVHRHYQLLKKDLTARFGRDRAVKSSR